MLKNLNTGLIFRNFLQNNMHLDYFFKKISINIIKIFLKISVFFLEKHIIEYLPKNINNLLSPNNIIKNKINFNFFNNLIFFLNLIIIVLII